MTMLESLAISLPTLLTIFGLVISYQNYKLKKKDSDKKETQEDVEKVKAEAQREKENELRLLNIEKDVQYIRLTVDKIEKRGEDHEHRISKLEKTCKTMKNSK